MEKTKNPEPSESASDNVVFKRAKHQDAERCNAFYNRIYEIDRPVAGWHWEFSEHTPSDTRLPFILIERAQTVVGTQAYIPIEMIDKDGAFPTGKSEETLVDPSMRGKQMFKRLYEHLFEVAQEEKIHGLWGFTPAGKAFRKIGFDTPATVTQLFKPLSADFVSHMRLAGAQATGASTSMRWKLTGVLALGVSCVRRPFKRDPLVDVTELSESPDWVDELSEAFVTQWGGVSLHRTRKYCDWRFFRNPYTQCRFWAVHEENIPVGFAVTAMHASVLYVVDIVLTSKTANGAYQRATPHLVATVLQSLETIAKSSQASGIRAWHGSDHPFALIILKSAKRLGWFHYRKGNEIVLWRNKVLALNRLPADPNQYYITRAFTEGHMG